MTNLIATYTPTTTRSDNLQDCGFFFTYTGITGNVVTQLGAWKTTGNTGTWTITLRNSGNTAILASATISMAGATAGQFNYANCTQVGLVNGTTYFLLVDIPAGQTFPDTTALTMNSGSSAGGRYQVPGVGLGAGNSFGSGNQYGGGDLVFVPPNASFGQRPQQQWEQRRVALDENDTYRRPVNCNIFFIPSNVGLLGQRPQQQWEQRRVALDENDIYRRPVNGNIFIPSNASFGQRPQQQWEQRRVALDENDIYRRPVNGKTLMQDVTFEIVPWLGAETYSTVNPPTHASYVGMENWINNQTVTFGNVDYLGAEVFLARVGLSGAYTSQLMLETWLIPATDEKGVEVPKLGTENWFVSASWSAQLTKLATEVFLVVPFALATVIIPKAGSEVFMEKSGQPAAFIAQMGVEIWFPRILTLDSADEVNIVIWMH
jgi:hypothetical protein